ncbi:MAG: lipocalin-like domain-containing protein [Candidatus Melainabacteria bacterium]|nr:lipocalin-like domain-containing protein [Candidatus Melainabacteria bacterium]
MSNKNRKTNQSNQALLLLLLVVAFINLWIAPTLAETKGYRQALPGYKYQFPRDHGSHEDFKTEWWYYTGHMQTESNKKYGYELTFFRHGIEHDSSLKNKQARNVYLAHFALTDESAGKFQYFEKMSRSGLPVAGAESDVLAVHNQGWTVEQFGDKFVLRADGDGSGIRLMLSAAKPPVIHGKDGVSQKASCKGCASHYYSMTRLKTEGTVIIAGKREKIKSGWSWMDHEFGSNQLTEEQIGWDWYSIQLDNNTELMLYVMRRRDGSIDKNSSGTIIGADGSSTHLTRDQFQIKSASKWASPRSKGVYPMDWSVDIPTQNIKLTIKATSQDQELMTKRSTGVTYWEGSAKVSGAVAGKPVKGQGYVEMTGYSEIFKKKI